MNDLDAIRLDAIYDLYSVDAVLTLDNTDADEFTLPVIDKTGGIEIGEGVDVFTIRPAVAVRAATLTDLGLVIADLSGASLALNDKDWRVENVRHRPGQSRGEQSGEVLLLLSEA